MTLDMNLDVLTAVSPIDGRYRSKCEPLAPYFSEYALMKYRTRVEIEYFIWLTEIPLPQLKGFDKGIVPQLRAIYNDFSEKDAARVKEIEKTTNHDVKAIEYFIKEKLDEIGGFEPYKEFIHFGLTSQDINNTSFPLMLSDALNDVYYPQLDGLIDKLNSFAEEWKDIPMLARTHGQPASPTRLGKEIKVFAYRLERQKEQLKGLRIAERLGLEREEYTTQISNYDGLAAVLDALKRINTVILDLDRDFWTYISMNYFKQKIRAGEVGSSAMPHKVNPIDYENSEGNIGIANALFEHLSHKLPVSRLQRDLTDSTVIRNVGVPLAHTIIAIQSTMKGLGKLLIHRESIDADLDNNWAVVAEAIQTILRREGYPHPYEALKALTRTNTEIRQKDITDFIKTLNVPDNIKEELKKITPHNYVGI